MNAYLAYNAARRVKRQFFLFLVNVNGYGRATEGASTTEYTLIVIEGNVAPGLIKRFPHLDGIEPGGVSGKKVFQDGWQH